MPSTTPTEPGDSRSTDRPHARFGRRALLASGATGLGLGAALGAGGIAAVAGRSGSDSDSSGSSGSDHGAQLDFGTEVRPCHGPHQAGIVGTPGAHCRYLAYELKDETDRGALARMFRVLTDDIEALTSGLAPLADSEPELAARPSGLTVTVGIGRTTLARTGAAPLPEWLAPLPAFERDRLGAGFDDGDLLLIVQADDPLAVSHASRMLHRDLARFANPLWQQHGFRHARGSAPSGTTMRNLFGQVDGTVNPASDEAGFDRLVWLGDEMGPLVGGSALVIRRIRMDLDRWDRVDRPGREQSVGRRLSDGSPLSAPAGSGEHTMSDFSARNALGLSAIPLAAHIRRAHSTDTTERILRRSSNYDEGGESGLIFTCFQRDPLSQFVPIQRRLDEADLLNEWIAHTGSAVFAILPGFGPGEILGARLFSDAAEAPE